MKPKLVFILLLIALLLVSIPAAQANPLAYDLSWWKVAAGGGDSHGGAYLLQGTVGQSEPGTLSGGTFSLSGGFWPATQLAGHRIFMPFLSKSN